MADLVSILIPAYNAEAFVAETVKSAVEQTWPRKEIIVVDDGSRDHTYEVLKRLQARDVKVVTQDNAGAPAARNHALRLAQGEYIQWLDADDLLHPDKIRFQMQGAESGLTSRTLRTASWGKFFFRKERAEFTPDSLWRDLGPAEWLITKFRDNVWMNPAVWLVSRKLTDMAGPWDPRLAKSGDDDGEYICRIVASAEDVRFIADAVAYYRIGTVGSLNWNMETSEESLLSLIVSLKLSVVHLLRLEDSPRTRHASQRYLETFSLYFYGREPRYFADLSNFARQVLGAELRPPSVSWKYRPLELVAGPRFTRKAVRSWRSAKTLLRRRYEASLQ